jgi:hypothetical protein
VPFTSSYPDFPSNPWEGDEFGAWNQLALLESTARNECWPDGRGIGKEPPPYLGTILEPEEKGRAIIRPAFLFL